jgi:putative FmdB family regulatory protein
MPIYSYQCQACGHELEALQKISDQPLTDCPVCHQSELKKQLTAAGFRLNGSGWYETDFKKEKRRNLAGDQPSESKPKPEAKPKSKEAAGSTPAA